VFVDELLEMVFKAIEIKNLIKEFLIKFFGNILSEYSGSHLM